LRQRDYISTGAAILGTAEVTPGVPEFPPPELPGCCAKAAPANNNAETKTAHAMRFFLATNSGSPSPPSRMDQTTDPQITQIKIQFWNLRNLRNLRMGSGSAGPGSSVFIRGELPR
jgi:hypothetical protein